MNRELNAMVGAEDFLDAHPLTPPNAAATTQKAILSASIVTMLAQGAGQVGGRLERHAGVGDRRATKKQLRAMLSDLVKTARTLDEDDHPEAAEVRMPRSSGYQATRDAAQAVSAIVTAHKEAFIELDWPADVDTQLTALIAQFDAAFTRKNHGQAMQISSTEGLAATAKAGIKAMRALDAIVGKRLKSHPGLLAAWKNAIHIQRPPKSKDATVASVKTATKAAAPAAESPAPEVPVAAVAMADPTNAVADATASGEVQPAGAPVATA